MTDKTLPDLETIAQSPLIVVIGATAPTNPYTLNTGMEVGYALRQSLNDSEGTIFTGGVQGVGTDVYAGIIKYCIEQMMETGSMPDDRFFVLVPDYNYGMVASDGELVLPKGDPERFNVPSEYRLLAALSSTKRLDVIIGGQDMSERRKILSNIADYLVVVNGGGGTLDEAVIGLQAGKTVISLHTSGGAAEKMMTIKDGSLQNWQAEQLFGSVKDYQRADMSKLHIVNEVGEIIRYLSQQPL